MDENSTPDAIGTRRLRELYGNGGDEERRIPVRYETLKERAKETMADGRYQYLASGAGREGTMSANREAFERWRIVPRVLRDVADRDLGVELLDREFTSPVMLAPVASQGVFHEDGERASARAAESLAVPYVASSGSSITLEEIADVLGETPRWFQCKLLSDEAVLASLVDRAEAAGFGAIVVTVDAPVPGWRERLLESGYRPTQEGSTVANYFSDPVFRSTLEASPENDPEAATRQYRDLVWDPSVDWEDFASLRSETDLPLLVKGILDPSDAERAVECGADGVVVSNHGGRQLDGAIGSLDCLPDVVDAIGDRAAVVFDSGIRTGPDIFKAIALGADAVFVGRPYLFGLALDGQNGVEQVLENLHADLDVTLGLAGYRSFENVNREAVSERDY